MNDYFDFRIVKSEDGTEIVEPGIITLCSSLTPEKLIEYIEMDNQIACMKRMIKREKKEQRKSFIKNSFFKFTRMCSTL